MHPPPPPTTKPQGPPRPPPAVPAAIAATPALPAPSAKKVAYLFLDEGGNLDFSVTGTKFFTLTSLLLYRPFLLDEPLNNLRFDLLESGIAIEKFHATEDKQATRDKVFAILQPSLPAIRIDSVVVEKNKTGPPLRKDERFYPEMLGYLIRYVVTGIVDEVSRVIVITDTIPVNRKRAAVEKAVKQTLASMLTPIGISHEIHHHDSRSCHGLQLADYVNWAIYRAHERGDDRSLALIKPALRSRFEIFKNGRKVWY